MRLPRAQAVLENIGLAPLIELVTEGRAGVVLAQRPRAGASAPEGMRVRLRVGRG
jgi:beta-lactam-binding protein with PASTA domain